MKDTLQQKMEQAIRAAYLESDNNHFEEQAAASCAEVAKECALGFNQFCSNCELYGIHSEKNDAELFDLYLSSLANQD